MNHTKFAVDNSMSDRSELYEDMAIEPQLGADKYVEMLVQQIIEMRPDLVLLEYSGGHDSTSLLYRLEDSPVEIDAVVHLNTGIGAEYTRQYVREHVSNLGLRYIEGIQPDMERRYAYKVMGYGFPGPRPGVHEMYRRNGKQDVEDAILRSFDGQIAIITGVSRYESSRRHRTVASTGIQESARHSDVTYVAPFAELTGHEIAKYMKEYDVERNELADLIDSSGECLCGPFDSFYDLEYIYEYEPWFVVALWNLMLLVNQYWVDYRDKHGKPPFPRQWIIWGHGGVRDGVLFEMVQGELDDPDDFTITEIEERAEKAEDDEQQVDLSNKCASCNYGPKLGGDDA